MRRALAGALRSAATSSERPARYYTGDLATRDAGGYLWFVGRADDLISSAGYRISPFEVGPRSGGENLKFTGVTQNMGQL